MQSACFLVIGFLAFGFGRFWRLCSEREYTFLFVRRAVHWIWLRLVERSDVRESFSDELGTDALFTTGSSVGV